ncbi:hypothetical protein L4X63_20465 [Geomonas sp. Red32]|uniref:hypothetical protein n=1 Tax=Geomonas sp. Red32 TaxID=2912856 RepID=UPI00202CAC9B|nr:hypothetical protein [Geomonas sp. Red32]MCM0083960.1 hypothetical protein [Geomonas sp. Red32]
MTVTTWPPAPSFSSGFVCRGLDESREKIRLFLSVERLDLVTGEVRKMTKAVGYLKANFPPKALARGPVR